MHCYLICPLLLRLGPADVPIPHGSKEGRDYSIGSLLGVEIRALLLLCPSCTIGPWEGAGAARALRKLPHLQAGTCRQVLRRSGSPSVIKCPPDGVFLEPRRSLQSKAGSSACTGSTIPLPMPDCQALHQRNIWSRDHVLPLSSGNLQDGPAAATPLLAHSLSTAHPTWFMLRPRADRCAAAFLLTASPYL